MPTLDELFEKEAAKRGAIQDTPSEIARRKSKAAEEMAREIRQGLRDANGDWVEQNATVDDDEEETDEDE